MKDKTFKSHLDVPEIPEYLLHKQAPEHQSTIEEVKRFYQSIVKFDENGEIISEEKIPLIDVPEEAPQKPAADETHEFKTKFKATFDVNATVWAKDLKTAKQIIIKKLKLAPELAEPLSEVQDIESSRQKLESVEVEEVKI